MKYKEAMAVAKQAIANELDCLLDNSDFINGFEEIADDRGVSYKPGGDKNKIIICVARNIENIKENLDLD